MTPLPVVDPFTFEVIRHRLWTINVEGALALQRVSGSPLATEAFDMNTSLMTSEGDVVFVGPYLLTGPMGQGLIVRAILDGYADNPGIEAGDMFICNDPYSGAAHQNCVTVVAPLFHDGGLFAWCGATLHVVDVGGPKAGQVGYGASSVFEEAPVMPPLKIVAGGRLLKDVEANYLRRSRTPALNALDLRGKIAALNTIGRRVADLVAEHGAARVRAVMEGTIDRSEALLRQRLAALPDATHHHTAYLDRSDTDPPELYAVDLVAAKRADRLVLDWRASSPQAGAVVNCTRSALLSGVLVAVLTYLGYDSDWCPAAVQRVVEVESSPGSVVDATWPAGCSMATMAAGFAATTATAVCLGRMLASSAGSRDQSMATWAGAVGSVDVFGRDAEGNPFGTVLLDSMVSGTGARSWEDGIDGGGFLRSIGCVVANIETYEARFPLLYLYRRLLADTGGPGTYRGGVGCTYAVVPHGVAEIQSVTPHFSGTRQPESVGLVGGYPGGINIPFVVRDAGWREAMRSGNVPAAGADLAGAAEHVPGISNLRLGADDVFGVIVTGGGGWGDPLGRDASRVADDVASGYVGAAAAGEIYGVVVGDGGAADVAASDRRRQDLRAARRERAVLDENRTPEPAGRGPTGPCPHCGATLPEVLPSAVAALGAAGPYAVAEGDGTGFALVEWYCPACWSLVEAQRRRSDG